MIFSVPEPASDEHLNITASYYLHVSLKPSLFQSIYFINFRHPYYSIQDFFIHLTTYTDRVVSQS